MGSDLFQHLRSIEILTASEKPDFVGFEVDHEDIPLK
jgi:hypothetical protein